MQKRVRRGEMVNQDAGENDILTGVSQPGSGRVALHKRDIGQSLHGFPRIVQHLRGKIDAGDRRAPNPAQAAL